MTSERALWATTKRHLGIYGAFQRIESPTEPGIPDLCYTALGATGWVELKELDAWPKREKTPVRIGHLRPEQVLWLEEWLAAGGRAYTLLQVQREYLLLDVGTTRAVYERLLTRGQLTERALVAQEGKFPTREVLRCLTSPR